MELSFQIATKMKSTSSAEIDVDDMVRAVNSKYNWDFSLKDAQRQVITEIMKKKNAFAVLPTGYGKSLCYMLPPLIYDQVNLYHGRGEVLAPGKCPYVIVTPWVNAVSQVCIPHNM